MFARNPGRLDLSIVCFSAMETVISIEYKELIRDGEFEMKTQIQDFLDSKLMSGKSVSPHTFGVIIFPPLEKAFLFTASSRESWRRTCLGANAV